MNRMFYPVLALLLALSPLTAHAQWRLQHSGVTASLRGIHAVNDSVAWASGSGGTVLRTTDGGAHWQNCTVPAGGEKLDFRSVWAWDADRAMVLSSGPGQASRLYSTHDGCRSWRLVFTNPDADGFWDGLQFDGIRFGAILGDPVHGMFTLFVTYDGGTRWTRQLDPCLRVLDPKQGAFAASNQSLAVLRSDRPGPDGGGSDTRRLWFGTSGGWMYGLWIAPLEAVIQPGCVRQRVGALDPANPAAGIFAVAFRDAENGVAVGGDYAHASTTGIAGTKSGATPWRVAVAPPRGYRSTVGWDPGENAWIAAGTTGSDISHDGGRTWQPFSPEGWNAVSLPFAVGEKGKVGRLISWGELRAFSPENE
jgi:hypothetical protein